MRLLKLMYTSCIAIVCETSIPVKNEGTPLVSVTLLSQIKICFREISLYSSCIDYDLNQWSIIIIDAHHHLHCR